VLIATLRGMARLELCNLQYKTGVKGVWLRALCRGLLCCALSVFQWRYWRILFTLRVSTEQESAN
jgi:hypothetical protein